MFLYCDTTDGGADQVARRKQIRAALSDVTRILYVDCTCLLHAFHLMVRETLEMIDKFLQQLKVSHPNVTKGFQSYCASVAKCSNFFRSHVQDFISSWESIHGPSKASARTDPKPVPYRRYPLAVISGRWGSIEAAEQFYIQRTRELMEPVFMSVLSKYMKAHKEQATEAGPASKKQKVGETQAEAGGEDASASLLGNEEEKQAFRIKMSKWAQGSMAAVQNSLFWLLLHIASVVRTPLSHFFAWAQLNSRRRMIQQLVTGRAAQFMKEFETLVVSFDSWFADAIKEAKAFDLPEKVVSLVRTLALKLVVAAAGSFCMRVLEPVQRCSCAWVVK